MKIFYMGYLMFVIWLPTLVESVDVIFQMMDSAVISLG